MIYSRHEVLYQRTTAGKKFISSPLGILNPAPVFVNLLRSKESIPHNRFVGSLNVYKYGQQSPSHPPEAGVSVPEFSGPDKPLAGYIQRLKLRL